MLQICCVVGHIPKGPQIRILGGSVEIVQICYRKRPPTHPGGSQTLGHLSRHRYLERHRLTFVIPSPSDLRNFSRKGVLIARTEQFPNYEIGDRRLCMTFDRKGISIWSAEGGSAGGRIFVKKRLR